MPPDASSAQFGEVWLVKTGDRAVPRLIVSGRRYATSRPNMVLTAEVDAPPDNPSYAPPSSGLLGEEVPGVGRAQLDLINVVLRNRLLDKVGEIRPGRHASVAERIQLLFGP